MLIDDERRGASTNTFTFSSSSSANLCCRVAFMYLGMSTMVPWNFLVAVTAFWNFKFRNVSMDYQGALNNTWEPERGAMVPTQIQLAFPSYLAIASNVPGAMTTLVHSFCGQRIGYVFDILLHLDIYILVVM